jgi:hypothetical protein
MAAGFMRALQRGDAIGIAGTIATGVSALRRIYSARVEIAAAARKRERQHIILTNH